MFTGIVSEVGEIESVEGGEAGLRLRVAARCAAELSGGDSVSVAGVCLTVADAEQRGFAADVMNQTLAVTTLGERGAGDPVNVEPALRVGDPLGGHLVQGHVDGVAEVASVEPDGFARRVVLRPPAALLRYVAERGSVAIEGVSLTVSGVFADGFAVSLIPETLERTTLGALRPADRVNLEVDVLARYVERLVSGFGPEGKEDDGATD